MSQALWKLSATELGSLIQKGEISSKETTQSVLDRIAAVNPHINALAEVMAQEAMAAADNADAAQARGDSLGPLHGLPVTIKVNVDVAGHATTEGLVALKDNIAREDSPLVASLRHAGAIIVGRNNTPAFSLRWFTDNDVHGRTLNPWNPAVTPGGSSGGAAAAVATGMGPIAHGNDYGGSIRHPAWACGVVGLRTTAGRVPSYKQSGPNRILSNQMMSVQGPLTRTVADARLALSVMAQGSPLDPNWVPAPLEYPNSAQTKRVAVFRKHAAYEVDPSVSAAVDQAATWLAQAGYEVEEVEPPHFEEGAHIWRQLVMDDMRRGGQAAIAAMGDKAVKATMQGYMAGLTPLDRDQTLEMLTRRLSICRDWAVFLDRYPVLLMPNSWQRQFPVDADLGGDAAVQRLVAAQAPLLGTAMMGLPGLSVPTGVVDGLPVGVQLVATRFREDLLLRAGERIERAAQYDVLAKLFEVGCLR